MANRRLAVVDVHELVRLKRAQTRNSEIGRLLEVSQPTVRKYVEWAGQQGLLENEMPSREAIRARLDETLPEGRGPQQVSSLAEHEDEIRELRRRKVELRAIQQRLEERHGEPVSYEALRRLGRADGCGHVLPRCHGEVRGHGRSPDERSGDGDRAARSPGPRRERFQPEVPAAEHGRRLQRPAPGEHDVCRLPETEVGGRHRV